MSATWSVIRSCPFLSRVVCWLGCQMRSFCPSRRGFVELQFDRDLLPRMTTSASST